MSRIFLSAVAVLLILSHESAARCPRDQDCLPEPVEPDQDNSEAACEATLLKSWQSTLPSLGYASKLAAQAIDPVITKQLDHAWMTHPQFKGGRWPGVTVAISQYDRLVFAKSYGFADMAAPHLTHPDDLYRLASDSKQLTGATILKLIHNGQSVDGTPANKLTLDSKVFEILASAPNAILPSGGLAAVKPELMNITVEQVLHHTGGWTCNVGDPVWYASNVKNAVLPVKEADVVKYMMTQYPSLMPPGLTFSYSNFGYNLLASLITKITGKDYESVVKDEMLAPIGITRTRVGQSLLSGRADGEVRYYAHHDSWPVTSLFPAATGVTISGDDKIPYGSWSLEAGRGAGGWIASAPDTLRFQLAVNGRGKTQVYPGIRAEIEANHNQPSWSWTSNSTCSRQAVNPVNDRYNAGWGIHSWGNAWNGMEFDHGGGTNGNGAVSVSLPSKPKIDGYGIVILHNTTPGDDAPSDPADPNFFNPGGAVINALQALLPTTNGSLLDPAWSPDTDFFDQYGSFTLYASKASLTSTITNALQQGCDVKGIHHPKCYASRLEGRLNGGALSYRAQMVPLHNGDAAWSAMGQSCTSYVAEKKNKAAAGYREVNLQWFRDADSRMRFQTVWVNIKH